MVDVPTWQDITKSKVWPTLAPEKQNSVRERWIQDVNDREPNWTTEQREALRSKVFEGAQEVEQLQIPGQQPQDQLQGGPSPEGLLQPVPQEQVPREQIQPPQQEQLQPQAEEVREGPAEIFTPVGRAIESLMPESVRDFPLGPKAFASTADHLFSIISTPLSFALGGLKAYNKPLKDDPAGFKSAFSAAWDNISGGRITDASSVRKELTDKTFEEAHGLFLGTVANIALSMLADPLIIPTLATKSIMALKDIAKGKIDTGKAAKILGELTDSKQHTEILKEVERGFRIVRKKLKPGKVVKPAGQLKAPVARAELPPAKGQKALGPAKALELPGARVALPKTTITKGVREAGPIKLPAVKGEQITRPITTVKAAIKAPDVARKPVKTDVGYQPKPTRGTVIQESETVDDFIKRGGEVERVPGIQESTKQYVGNKAAQKARNEAMADLGIDVNVRKGLKYPGEAGENLNAIHLLDDADDGEFLGSIIGGAQKHYERAASRAERGVPTVEQMELKNSWLSVEKPWQDMNKPKTGFAVKNIYSRMESVELQAKKTMQSLAKAGKTGFRTLLRRPGAKAKGYSKQDLPDLVYYAEDKKLWANAPAAVKEKLGAGVKIIRNFLDDGQKLYRELGANPDFKNNTIKYYQESNASIRNTLKDINSGKTNRVTKADLKGMGIKLPKDIKFRPKDMKRVKEILAKEFKDNTQIVKRMDDLEYVHIPHAMWFDDAGVDKAALIKSIKLANLKHRKTIFIRDLVESGAIKADAVNPFDIISSYSRRMAKDMAMLDIKKAATAEGMISGKKIPGFEKVDHKTFPLFAGKYVHPAFKTWLYNFKTQTVNANRIDRVFSKVKMWQFIKPLFLPYYDLYQHVALKNIGLINPIGTGKDIYKSVKNVFGRTPEYFKALDDGIASKPFDLPWKTQAEFVEKMKSTSFGSWIWKASKQNKTLIKPIYETLWNTAWTGDELVRFMSLNYLKRKGMGDHEAAQLAALFHSDYASVPVATRRTLNKLFFTPTFKITMFKLYKEMVRAAVKVPAKTLIGKYKDLTKQDKILARGGAATVFGMMVGFDQVMQGLGYQRDQFARRYYKPVSVDGQEKESVQVFANPMTLIPKYMAKAEAFANDFYADNALVAFYRAVKYELHPIYRIGVELATNVGNDNKMIVNPMSDSDGMKLGKRIRYAAKEALKIIDTIDRSKKGDQDTAYRLFVNDLGKVTEDFGGTKILGLAAGALVSPTMFSYLRAPTVRRERARLFKLKEEYNNTIWQLKRTEKYDKKTAHDMQVGLRKKTDKIYRLIELAERKNDLYWLRQYRDSER